MNQHDQMREALQAYLDAGHGQHADPVLQLHARKLAEQALAHVNETPKNEHDSDDVLNKSGNVDMMREALRDTQNFLTECEITLHLDIAQLRILEEKINQALATEPAPLVMVTDLEMLDMYCEPNSDKEMFEFGRAVQKRFMEKNGLKHEPN